MIAFIYFHNVKIILWLEVRRKFHVTERGDKGLWITQGNCVSALVVLTRRRLAVKGHREGKNGWILSFKNGTRKQTTLKCITFLHWSSFLDRFCLVFLNSVCVHIQYNTSFYIIGHHIPRQRKAAVHYLVYLDIWLLLFRSAPTQISLIALTNIASPACHKSKQDTVVSPLLGPNLNVSAGVNSGTENPYAFCVHSLPYCKLPDIVFVLWMT